MEVFREKKSQKLSSSGDGFGGRRCVFVGGGGEGEPDTSQVITLHENRVA